MIIFYKENIKVVPHFVERIRITNQHSHNTYGRVLRLKINKL